MWKSRAIGLITVNTFGSSLSCSSVNQSGLIAGGKDSKEGQTVFFASVDLMNEPQRDEPYDVKKPRLVLCRTKWTVNQNAVCCINKTEG